MNDGLNYWLLLVIFAITACYTVHQNIVVGLPLASFVNTTCYSDLKPRVQILASVGNSRPRGRSKGATSQDPDQEDFVAKPASGCPREPPQNKWRIVDVGRKMIPKPRLTRW